MVLFNRIILLRTFKLFRIEKNIIDKSFHDWKQSVQSTNNQTNKHQLRNVNWTDWDPIIIFFYAIFPARIVIFETISFLILAQPLNFYYHFLSIIFFLECCTWPNCFHIGVLVCTVNMRTYSVVPLYHWPHSTNKTAGISSLCFELQVAVTFSIHECCTCFHISVHVCV